tara:strand:+ start:201 stop:788 length:588 start_codon:yes stop_codon:yes gene_type:complete
MPGDVSLSDGKNLQYVIQITYLFALIGTFANILFTLINQNPGTAAEVSLGIAGAGIMFSIIFTMMYLNMTDGGFTTIDGMPDPKKIIKFILQLLPTITTFIVIILYFILNAVYQKRIDGHNVATEYKSYATLSSILVFIQTALVGAGLWNIFKPSEEESQFKKINKLLIIIILFIINLYLCGISNVILKYFSTDG